MVFFENGNHAWLMMRTLNVAAYLKKKRWKRGFVYSKCNYKLNLVCKLPFIAHIKIVTNSGNTRFCGSVNVSLRR